MDSGNKKPDYCVVTVKTTDGSTVQGKVYLSSKDRVSDLFTANEAPFIIVVDALSRDGEGKTLFINKEQIVWVEPEENAVV